MKYNIYISSFYEWFILFWVKIIIRLLLDTKVRMTTAIEQRVTDFFRHLWHDGRDRPTGSGQTGQRSMLWFLSECVPKQTIIKNCLMGWTENTLINVSQATHNPVSDGQRGLDWWQMTCSSVAVIRGTSGQTERSPRQTFSSASAERSVIRRLWLCGCCWLSPGSDDKRLSSSAKVITIFGFKYSRRDKMNDNKKIINNERQTVKWWSIVKHEMIATTDSTTDMHSVANSSLSAARIPSTRFSDNSP